MFAYDQFIFSCITPDYTLNQTHVLFSLICALSLSPELPLLPFCSLECPFFYSFEQKGEGNFTENMVFLVIMFGFSILHLTLSL